jgi:hypothetical protein
MALILKEKHDNIIFTKANIILQITARDVKIVS